MDDRPLCPCHGEPMVLNGKHRSGKTKYQCRIKNRSRFAAWMEQASPLQRSARDLQTYLRKTTLGAMPENRGKRKG